MDVKSLFEIYRKKRRLNRDLVLRNIERTYARFQESDELVNAGRINDHSLPEAIDRLQLRASELVTEHETINLEIGKQETELDRFKMALVGLKVGLQEISTKPFQEAQSSADRVATILQPLLRKKKTIVFQ